MMALLTPAYNHGACAVIPFAAKVEDRGLPDVAPTRTAAMERHNAEIDARKRSRGKNWPSCAARMKSGYSTQSWPKAAGADPSGHEDGARDRRGKTNRDTEISGRQIVCQSGGEARRGERRAMSAAEKFAVTEAEAAITAAEFRSQKWGKIQALYDVGPPVPTHLLVRGSEESPGAEVPPGFLRVLTARKTRRGELHPIGQNQWARTALARWMTDSHSPAGAAGEGDGQSNLAASLWPRHRADSGQLRGPGAAANAS